MQANIAMKFAEYVVWILLYKHYKFGKKIYYSSRDIEFFLGRYCFQARPASFESTFQIIQDGGGRHLGFDVTSNSAVRSADPENPTIEPNMKCIGSPVAEIWPFVYLGGYGTPILGEGNNNPPTLQTNGHTERQTDDMRSQDCALH